MKVHHIHLTNVRGVDDRRYVFTDGVTVVIGPNEAGKSTVAESLQLLLEEKDSSNKAAVRSIRPVHNDADPTIELSCTTGPYTLTYRKVFGRTARRRQTVLTVASPRPEQHTSDEAHARMLEILGETVDEQLWAALRVQQRHDVGQADLASSGALAAALDAANEGGATLQEDGSLMTRVHDAFAEFWTDTGKPKKGLLEADELVAGTTLALDAARAELDGVAEATARHDRLVNQIDGWRRALPELERAAKEAAEVVAGLSSKRTAVTIAERAMEAAEVELLRARERAAARGAIVEQQTTLESSVSERAERAASVLEAAARADTDVASAREARDAARTVLDTARGALRTAEADVKLLRLDADIDALQRRVADAEALHDAREAARSDLDEDAPSAAALEQLDALASELRTTAAVLQADLPRLRVAGPTGRAVAIAGETVTLDADPVERAVDVETTVVVDDVLVTVLPGISAGDLADAHAEAERALRLGLEHVGAVSVADARTRRMTADAAEAELARTDDAWRQVLAADGLDGLRSSLAATRRARASQLAERDTSQQLPADVLTAETAVVAATEAVTAAEAAVAETDAMLDAATTAAGARRTEATTATVQLQNDRDRLDDLIRELTTARAELPDDALAATVSAAEAELAQARDGHADATASLAGLNIAGLEADAASAKASLEGTRRQLADANESRAELWGAIKATTDRGLGERVPELEATLAAALARAAALHHKADALALLRGTLLRHRDAARARYQAPLKAEVERIGSVVFGDSFEVTLDDELKIIERTLDGRTLEVDQLSGGAQEQLAIITRLAAAALVAGDDGVPLILDDTLGFADPERRGRVNALLGRVGQSSQIIVLTCDPNRFRGIPDATFHTLD